MSPLRGLSNDRSAFLSSLYVPDAFHYEQHQRRSVSIIQFSRSVLNLGGGQWEMSGIPLTMRRNYQCTITGDKLCGNKPVDVWFAVGAGNNTPKKSPLTCTEKGWMSGGQIVKPQKIFCKK